jgi:hypothetical protein
MRIFATPDFGASASAFAGLMCVWVIVFVFVAVGIVWGIKLLRGTSAKNKQYGICVLLLSALVPLCCCLGPPQVFRLNYGSYPLNTYPKGIDEGMSTDEVTAILGSPHTRYEGSDGVSWYYWLDSFNIHYFGVRFGPDGRVKSTHIN